MLMSALKPLAELESAGEFVPRHVGIDADDEAHMLSVIGAASRRALIEQLVPASIARPAPMRLPAPLGEAEALAELRGIAAQNRVLKSFIGQGYHGTHTPGVILRNVLESPAWYTAYTPYQAEISQGRLEALVNFQTMVCDLTGMAIANASMLDEATAAAEAMTLARRSVKAKSDTIVVAGDAHPQTIEVLRTRATPLGLEVVLANSAEEWDRLIEGGDYFAVLAQWPATSGALHDMRGDAPRIHAHGAAFIVAADLLALTLVTPPGELGADIACGTTQRFGMPMGCGGPHAAYLACRDEYKRGLPGRLVGVSIDAQGAPAYRLALQTREQHIRRERATSNICTAQVLPAVVASMYAVYHGPAGLKRIAERVAAYTAVLAEGLRRLGCTVRSDTAFDTLTLDTGAATAELASRAVAAGMNLRRFPEWGDTMLGIALDETTTRDDIVALWGVFAKDGQALPQLADFERGIAPMIPEGLRRTSSFLTHPVFNRHHSETEMLRYLRGLADKDLALDRSMIPLGSCTMKLNATSEMIPITWPEFANIHPFAPADQRAGYDALRRQLEAWLCEATGYAGISLQPNAGSQGEYAGLLAIRAWHASRGESSRTVCLIPESAHGTNPASAQMAGLQVVVTKCDADGNVDLADLEAKCKLHADRLACVMITYPSTYGVFERRVRELCEIVHRHGGRVYVDGANMNALVGVAAPGEFGGDVSHLNLHKTFCIPHGGGGPGVGPVCVVADLVPFLPGHASGGFSDAGASGVGAVSAAPLGNAARAADQLDVHAHDGQRGPAPRDRDRHPERQLHRRAPRRPLRAALQRQHRRHQGRRRRPRVHPRPAAAQGRHRRRQGRARHQRRGRRQAADRLRLPRADAQLSGRRHADGRADRERVARRARSLLRRDDRDPRRDRQGRGRHLAARRQPAQGGAAHGRGAARRRLAARLLARGGGVSARVAPARQVLVAGRPRRQRLGRPQPVVLVPADGQLRGLTS